MLQTFWCPLHPAFVSASCLYSPARPRDKTSTRVPFLTTLEVQVQGILLAWFPACFADGCSQAAASRDCLSVPIPSYKDHSQVGLGPILTVSEGLISKYSHSLWFCRQGCQCAGFQTDMGQPPASATSPSLAPASRAGESFLLRF